MRPETANIRDARIEDSPALARIQVDSYRAAYAGILPDDYLAHFAYEEQTSDWRELLSADTSDILLVAEGLDGEVVAYALSRPGATDLAPYEAELVALHVRRSAQRQGTGRRLVAESARRLREQGCASLLLWVLAENTPARRFYERLGGRVLGERRIELGEGEVGAVEAAYGWDDVGGLLLEEGAQEAEDTAGQQM